MAQEPQRAGLDKAKAFFARAEEVAATGNFDYAVDMYIEGLRRAPDAVQDGHIPLGARIIAVADSLDAITSKRVYKPAMGWDTAIAEMQRCSGTQFDPEVVRVFVSVADTLRPPEAQHQAAEIQEARHQAAASKGGGGA